MLTSEYANVLCVYELFIAFRQNNNENPEKEVTLFKVLEGIFLKYNSFCCFLLLVFNNIIRIC